jgi:hypothetical protein
MAVDAGRVRDVWPPPRSLREHFGSCFAAFVANTWTSAISIGLEFDGQSLNAASSA